MLFELLLRHFAVVLELMRVARPANIRVEAVLFDLRQNVLIFRVPLRLRPRLGAALVPGPILAGIRLLLLLRRASVDRHFGRAGELLVAELGVVLESLVVFVENALVVVVNWENPLVAAEVLVLEGGHLFHGEHLAELYFL